MSHDHQFEIVHASIQRLAENRPNQPDLQALAAKTGYGPSYIQRLFLDWARRSPKEFLQTLLTRVAAVKRLLAGGTNLEATFSAVLSSNGRLHDLHISTVALTPGEIKSRGKNVQSKFGTGLSPFEETIIAWIHRGVCFIVFYHDLGSKHVIRVLKKQWPDAQFIN